MFLDEWFTLVKANQSRIMQSLELRIRVHIHRIRPSRTKARSGVLINVRIWTIFITGIFRTSDPFFLGVGGAYSVQPPCGFLPFTQKSLGNPYL